MGFGVNSLDSLVIFENVSCVVLDSYCNTTIQLMEVCDFNQLLTPIIESGEGQLIMCFT